MNAIQAALLPYKDAGASVVDDPEKRLLARIALAEREFERGDVVPASQVASELYAIADRA